MKTAVEMFKEILEEIKSKEVEPNFARCYILGAYDMAKTVATIRGEDVGEIICMAHDFLYGGK